ncbi:ankyrin repeat domain-containing protein 6 [Caerostris extrusa]|uniref:Ankyrin repeat domain-containing protein 6 n=1 Tax=Caerostris extrusa TaxID=172846 RepID=A0AAV4VHF4_CAEEX|nr:ankyrin repeat domain-containing protein 6 [Caerostris extrusa]
MKTLIGKPPNGSRTNGHHESSVGNGNINYHIHNGNQPLLRSKSEDLLSETNSNHNSVSLMSSTVTGVSKFTNNSNYQRTFLNPAQCGTKPKANHISNISSKMRCLGYPELKCESRSEGDLTSCHTERNEYDSRSPDIAGNYSTKPPYAAPTEERHLKSNSSKLHISENLQFDRKNQVRASSNGQPTMLRDSVPLPSNQNLNSGDRNTVLPPPDLENDGSSFV